MQDKPKACEGGDTISDGDFEECQYCGDKVRHDLVDHAFFGFQASCEHRKQGINQDDGGEK